MDNFEDDDKRNITVSRLTKALYDELAQAAGEQPQWPISSATSLADWAVARAREAA